MTLLNDPAVVQLIGVLFVATLWVLSVASVAYVARGILFAGVWVVQTLVRFLQGKPR
jgi:hypothetical protein